MLEKDDDDDRDLEIDLDNEEEQEIEEEEDERAEKEDRGDDAEPEVNERNLRKVATEEEGEEEEAPDEAGGPSMIPKGRLNKALKARDEEREARIRAEERARLLEEQIRGQGGKKKEDETPAVDLKALRKQRMEAMMEGDIEKATELEEQIETEIRRTAREDAVAEVTAATGRQQFSEAVADVIEAYPFLDSKSKEANPDAIEQVVALRNQYINKGDSPGTALRKAAAKVGPLYEPKPKKGTKERDEEDDDEQEEERPSKKILSARERLALKRNADAARRQPAALKGGVGERATAAKINVAEMDEDEYARLPEKVKRQLRGDDV